MAANENLAGLSDFGLTAPSSSSGAANSSSPGQLDLKQLLGGVLDNAGKARILGSQAQQLQEQETPNLLQALLSPRVLSLLAGAGAGAALGGGQGALGGGLGGLGALQQTLEGERSAKDAAVDDLLKQRDKLLDLNEKSQTRFSSLINANPDILTNPATGEPDVPADVVGFLATGAPIPLYPHARRVMARRDERWGKRHELLTDALSKAASVEDARGLVNAVLANSGWDAPPSVIDELARANGTQDFNTAFANTMVRYGGASAKQALIYASENGLPVSHHDVLRRVDFNESGGEALMPTQQVTAQFLEAMEMVRLWQQDPANRETIRTLRTDSASVDDFNRGLAEAALGGRSEFLSLYMQKMGLVDAQDWQGIQDSYRHVLTNNKLADQITGFEKLPVRQNMSEEEKLRADFMEAQRVYSASRKAATQEQATQDAALMNGVGRRLQKDLSLSVEQTQRLVLQLINDATDTSGRIDEAELERLTQKAIADIQKANQ